MRAFVIFLLIMIFYPGVCLSQKYGISSNLAGLATGSLNIEASVAISRKVSLHLPVSWNPFIIGDNYKINHIVIQPGARWWLWHSYDELFIGIQEVTGFYNIAISDVRYEGWSTGISLSCGYAWMLSSKWNVEFEAGVGCLFCKYDKYYRPKCGEYLGSAEKIIYGPTRLSLSLMYIF